MPNCSHSGLSSPYAAARFFCASGDNGLAPSATGSSGLPGVACITRNVTSAIASSVGTNHSTRASTTTWLKVLATLVRPTRGTVTVAGHDCSKDPELVRREIGLVAHSAYVYEDLTAAENLTFWATLAGLRPSAAERAGALATVELERAAVAFDTPRGSLSADDVHRLYALHAEDAS